MGELRAIWVAGNEYLTRAAPWTHIKTDRAKAAVGVRMGLNLVHQFAHLDLAGDAGDGAENSRSDPAHRLRRTALIPWPDQPMAKALDELEPGQPIHPPDVCSPRSPTNRWRSGRQRFGGSDSGAQ